MSNVLVLFIFSSIVFTALSVSKQLGTFELFCTYRFLPKTDQLSGMYVVSGMNEKIVNFQIYSPTNQVVFKVEKEREAKFEIIAEEDGEYRACFRNTQREAAFINFEIVANMSEPKSQMVDSNLITEMDIDLTSAIRQLRLIRTNQGHQEFRDRIHGMNLSYLESQINWTTFFKVTALASIGIGQAYILTTLFKKKLMVSV